MVKGACGDYQIANPIAHLNGLTARQVERAPIEATDPGLPLYVWPPPLGLTNEHHRRTPAALSKAMTFISSTTRTAIPSSLHVSTGGRT
jgi:hypothetical protein